MNEPDSEHLGSCGLGGSWGFLGRGLYVTLEGSGLSLVPVAWSPGPTCFVFEFLFFPSLGQEGRILGLLEHPSLWGRAVAAWAGGAGAWAVQAVRGAAWRRWPLLWWQVMEAGICEEGLLGMGVICRKAYV